MERLEEIRKRAEEEFYIKRDIDFYDAQEDMITLLSLIDRYEMQTESHQQVMTEKREMIELMVRKGIISPDQYLEVVNQVLYRKGE